MDQKNPLTPEQIQALTKHAEIMQAIYAEIAKRGLVLHEGQIALARDILVNNKRVVQAQWGRKAGKTETSCFLAWTYALTHPGCQVWVICPQRKQGKDIYWISGRIQKFGPQQYVSQHKESELSVELTNGSIIRIDGCENYPALRGINPDFVIYDEFQDHSKEFHVEVMAPNLIAKGASLLAIGTPPKRDCYYVEFRKQLMSEIKEGDTTRAYYEFPSWINPSLDRTELEKVKQRLYKAGDEKIWLREYEAQLIFGGEGAVFSPWNREKHIKNHKVLMSAIERDAKNLKWYTVFDPGNMTCFAVLFMAYNPYTSQIFLLDEIYETNPRNTDCVSIWQRALAKEKELYPNRPVRTFHRIYDEAAQWFFINLQKFYRLDPEFYMSPCQKNKAKYYSSKEADCSLIKQIMGMDNCFFVSDRCAKFAWEVENYVVDEKGDYPDEDDHLLDDLIYGLKGCGYKFVEDVPLDMLLQSTYIVDQLGKKIARTNLRDNSDWSDNVVEDSLFVDNISNEYFN